MLFVQNPDAGGCGAENDICPRNDFAFIRVTGSENRNEIDTKSLLRGARQWLERSQSHVRHDLDLCALQGGDNGSCETDNAGSAEDGDGGALERSRGFAFVYFLDTGDHRRCGREGTARVGKYRERERRD